MKRILMLEPINCGSGDTITGKIYDIIEDVLNVWNNETHYSDNYEYNQDNISKYPNGTRWITIEDESSSDSFEVEEYEKRFIIFDNDKELAHELINRIEGLDKTIVNMAMSFMKIA